MWTRSFSTTTSSVILLLLVFSFSCCHAQKTSVCVPSSCGNIKNITFPFRLKDDPRNCGNPKFELDCQNNHTILNLSSRSYYVQSINYESFTIRVVDSAIENNNLCSFPLNSTEDIISNGVYGGYSYLIPLVFIQCLNPVNSSRYVDISFCSNKNSSSSYNSSNIHSYIVAGNALSLADLEESCSVETVIQSSSSFTTNYSSSSSIHEAITYGIELSWIYSLCEDCHGHGDCILETNSVVCRPYSICYEHVPLSELEFHCRLLYWAPFIIVYGGISIGALLGIRFLCGFSWLIGLLVYKWRKRKSLSKYEHIEDLFVEQNYFRLIRYRYSEIKKMTNNFKKNLGVGGYGTVFKGKLRSGPPIVVKMMDKSMSSVLEFASIVATLAQIHHDNLLEIIGFCLEGEKQALVYDFMPNGSLQQYLNVTGEEGHFKLSYEKMLGISVEVARAIDHLHQNLDIQTLHIGFKPHNVLLDESLNPKISDFGLVKLYPSVDSMAPEFYYKNIGAVSYKADVYSYGILLMEMIDKIKDIAGHISPIHLPKWLYEQLKEGKDPEIESAKGEEMKALKKIIIVALWCIQMLPEDRPSMNKVVEMLEGDVELLKMPPNPFVSAN